MSSPLQGRTQEPSVPAMRGVRQRSPAAQSPSAAHAAPSTARPAPEAAPAAPPAPFPPSRPPATGEGAPAAPPAPNPPLADEGSLPHPTVHAKAASEAMTAQ